MPNRKCYTMPKLYNFFLYLLLGSGIPACVSASMNPSLDQNIVRKITMQAPISLIGSAATIVNIAVWPLWVRLLLHHAIKKEITYKYEPLSLSISHDNLKALDSLVVMAEPYVLPFLMPPLSVLNLKHYMFLREHPVVSCAAACMSYGAAHYAQNALDRDLRSHHMACAPFGRLMVNSIVHRSAQYVPLVLASSMGVSQGLMSTLMLQLVSCVILSAVPYVHTYSVQLVKHKIPQAYQRTKGKGIQLCGAASEKYGGLGDQTRKILKLGMTVTMGTGVCLLVNTIAKKQRA